MVSFIDERKRKQMTFTHQETLPDENDAACPHLGNWLCMYLNMNKWKSYYNPCFQESLLQKYIFITNIITYTHMYTHIYMYIYVIKGKLRKACSSHKSYDL